jgi:hypothetical protein
MEFQWPVTHHKWIERNEERSMKTEFTTFRVIEGKEDFPVSVALVEQPM